MCVFGILSFSVMCVMNVNEPGKEPGTTKMRNAERGMGSAKTRNRLRISVQKMSCGTEFGILICGTGFAERAELYCTIT